MYLPGVQIKEVRKIVDDRGFFSELFRFDWEKLFQDHLPVQFNYVVNHPNIVRAWHRHAKGQYDYMTCLEGSIKICIYDDSDQNNTKLNEITISHEKLAIVKVPGHYWHGYKVIGNSPAKIMYGVNNLYNYDDPDEERRAWNDNTIIPSEVNGSKNDPRIGTPWNWFYPPHR